ncbi:MAG: phospho-N-acetylmuramoyl-pentapeptide-transferase [Planctomycetes bacterium]|jgi:phospho-N-acetylmuramoyl-pentapeptide-transferase|nr:phospho-N-acetylmuramoyl-pentapeptide-transferase [Planctomycetota bacterium]
MIGWILSLLAADSGDFARDVLLRAGLASITAFCLTALATRFLLPWLKRRRVAERVDKTDSEKLAELHKGKADTPTMGGLALSAGVLASALLWADPRNPYVRCGLLLLAGFAALGFLDDWIKLTCKGRKGLTIKGKLLWQIALSAGAAVCLWTAGRTAAGGVEVLAPLWHAGFVVLPAALFLPFAVFVLVSTVNAVNFTDGLDGLASGVSVIALVPLAVLAWAAGRPDAAGWLGIPLVPGCGEASVLASAAAGAGLGFLWHNCFPARMFMGNTGSLPLGAMVGFTALAAKAELLLPLFGAVFVAEGMSVALQILSFRLTGRRLFLIAPLHHRYQFLGWPESRITVRFWIAAAVSAVAGAAVLRM